MTYFESVTATAFLCFFEEGVELNVIEVGLGGKLDATNVIRRPLVSAVVSIGRDHEHILGGTTVAIARDKAQIIKSNSQAVIGQLAEDELEEVYRVSKKVVTPVSEFGKDYTVELFDEHAVYRSDQYSELSFTVGLLGDHQAKNGAIALRIGELIGINLETASRGLSEVRWPARLEPFVLPAGQPGLLDCAHNPEGIRAICTFLESRGYGPDNQVEFVFGALQTKRWKEMVDMLVPYVNCFNLIEPASSRALPTAELADYLSSFEVSIRDFGSDFDSLLDELNAPSRTTQDLLVVLGSMYMVGEVRRRLALPEIQIWKN